MPPVAARITVNLILVLATFCLQAQSTPTPSVNAAAVSPLSEVRTWDFSVWAKEAVGNSAYGNVGDAFASMAGFHAGYVFARPAITGPLRGSLEYFFDVIPVFVLTKPQTIYGGGISPLGLKWNFENRRQPYLQVSLGGILSTRNVPPGDTSNFNFTVTADGGMAIVRRENRAITANVGFWHFSNANMGQTNPSLNALEFGIEYHWYKAK